MPYVTVKSMGSRSVEEKRALAKAITEVVMQQYKVPREAVTVELQEMSKEDLAVGGTLFCDRH